MPSPPAKTRPLLVILGLLLCAGMILFRARIRSMIQPAVSVARMKIPNPWRVDERVRQYGEAVRQRVEPDFRRAGIDYPPGQLAFVILKQERRLEMYAAPRGDGPFRFIRSYPVLAASGHAGPKLREGDLQVPEGIYRIESLDPNSAFHLALRVDYPNVFDRAQAENEHRANLGGDIMIHGSNVSVGCLAMGDRGAEDLFVLAALTGIENIRVVLSPIDFRQTDLPKSPADGLPWLPGLYEQIKRELRQYPVP